MSDPREPRIFCRYLIGEFPGDHLLQRYDSACKMAAGTNHEREQKLVKRCVKFPILLPFADAALASGNRDHLLRKKLLIMLAILETTPEYHSHFTAKDEGTFAWIRIMFRGAMAILKMLTGKLIMIFI